MIDDVFQECWLGVVVSTELSLVTLEKNRGTDIQGKICGEWTTLATFPNDTMFDGFARCRYCAVPIIIHDAEYCESIWR